LANDAGALVVGVSEFRLQLDDVVSVNIDVVADDVVARGQGLLKVLDLLQHEVYHSVLIVELLV
jgi:hypothetical protein